MEFDTKTLAQLIGIAAIIGSGIYNYIWGMFVGFAILVLSQASNIKQNTADLKSLKEKLNIKEEINKLWRAMDKKQNKKGAIDQTALWVIVIIILILIALYQTGMLKIGS